MKYIPRLPEEKIKHAVNRNKSVLLFGARQTGSCKNERVQVVWVMLLAAISLFMVGARPVFAEAEKENVKFAIPSTWVRGEKGARGEMSFVTSKDPTKGLIGYIRSFHAPQQTAREWAVDEAKQIESQELRIVVQPTERKIGNSTWVGLAWEQTMPVGGATQLMRGEQHYLKGKQAMIEIFLAGPKDLFEHFDRREIDEFFSNAGFDTRSLEEAKRTAEVEYIAEMATSMDRFAQPKKGEVVKGFISVRQGVKIPLQGDLIGDASMPVYTSARTLINGKTVFAGLLPREFSYKVLKIGYVGQEIVRDGTSGGIYEVEVEAVK